MNIRKIELLLLISVFLNTPFLHVNHQKNLTLNVLCGVSLWFIHFIEFSQYTMAPWRCDHTFFNMPTTKRTSLWTFPVLYHFYFLTLLCFHTASWRCDHTYSTFQTSIEPHCECSLCCVTLLISHYWVFTMHHGGVMTPF